MIIESNLPAEPFFFICVSLATKWTVPFFCRLKFFHLPEEVEHYCDQMYKNSSYIYKHTHTHTHEILGLWA